MTDEQYNKFLTLLRGECWHETWDWRPNDFDNPPYVCLECNKRAREVPQKPDPLANPLPVIRWMEKEMPEVLDNYLQYIWVECRENSFIRTLDKSIDLRNLIDYLWEHPEWGEKEICSDYDRYEKICPPFCNKCDGVTGKVIHPALVYLKSVKEEGC